MTHQPHVVANLEELCRSDTPVSWRIDLQPPEAGARRMSLAALAEIEAHPDATALTVGWLDQRTFEVLVSTYGARFSAISFCKCPRIADLTPLEGLPNLTHVAFFWNQRATRLWDFTRTPKLRGLDFSDFTRLHDLSDLSAAISLEELEFGDKIWPTSVFGTLDPLASLANLRCLTLSAKRIEDGRVEALASLRRLEYLHFPSNMFSTEQVAWLRAHLPESVTGTFLGPVRDFSQEPGEWTLEKDVLVVGKRKPWLDSVADAKRIQRYVDDFWRMVAEFERNPEAKPASTGVQSGT